MIQDTAYIAVASFGEHTEHWQLIVAGMWFGAAICALATSFAIAVREGRET